MNSGSWSMEPISQDNLLVFVALGLVAILAILTVIGMVVGARNKRRRVAAEQEEQARIDALRSDGVEVRDVSDGAAPEAETPAPAPSVAEQPAAPPPLADETAPADAPAAPASDATSVTRLKGLGPRIAGRLADLGITDVTQLAALSDAEAADLDTQLAPFQGRMERDRWREQARLLAAGDRAGFEREFGKLG